MPDAVDHHTTIISITGEHHNSLHFLANLSPTVSDPDSIWSVVATLSHRPEVQWTRMHMVESWLTSMDKTPSGKLFAVSMDGELHYVENRTWTSMDLGCPEGLNAIWAASDRDLFTVGLAGWRVRITDMVPQLSRDVRERRLNAVHGTSPEDVYAAGDDGIIFHYERGVWNELDSPTNAALLAVLCHNDDTYFAGAGGTLFRRNGDIWNELHSPEGVTITSLEWYDGALFAAAGLNGVYRLGPNGLERFKERIIYRLKTVGDLLFGFGNRLVIQFDGSGWWGGELNL